MPKTFFNSIANQSEIKSKIGSIQVSRRNILVYDIFSFVKELTCNEAIAAKKRQGRRIDLKPNFKTDINITANKSIGQKIGLCECQIAKVKKVINYGDQILIDKVLSNKIPIYEAYNIIRSIEKLNQTKR